MEARSWHAHYDEGVPPEVDFEDVTLPGLLRSAAETHRHITAIRFMNCTMTYEALDAEVDCFARALRQLGVETGDRVGIQMPNLPQTVIAYYGVLRAGGVAVMTNPLYTAREVVHQWKDAHCKVVVAMDFLYAQTLHEIADQVPVEKWIIASIPEYLGFPLNLLAPLKLRRQSLMADVPDTPGLLRFRACLDSAPAGTPLPKLGETDLAALQYTGGTTGVSKGAMLSHGNLSHQVQQLRKWMPDLIRGEEVFLSALPFFHVFGLTVALNLPVAVASEMVVVPNPREIPRLISSINKFGVTVFPIVPAMVNGINRHPQAKRLNVGTLKLLVSGSAPLPEDSLREFERLTGGRIVEGYGLTEASPVTHVNPIRGKRKVNHIGMPLPDTDCRVVSLETGEEVGTGEEGELLIRGPQVMQGYWQRPDETAETLQDGWLHTGDLACVDEDGYFRIVGRKKEMIVCGGYNVYPDEVDRVLMEHPGVAECATIGVPDERRGETVKSFVVKAPGVSLTAEEIDRHCREHLAAYKVPRMIEFRDELPKSSVLKILRRVLLEEELARGK